jgi:hypothetical protein
MKILVCGGRDFSDADLLCKFLNQLHAKTGFTSLAHGAAKGADSLAKSWARAKGIREFGYPAPWDDVTLQGSVIRHHPDGRPYNAAAGRLRNQWMLDVERPDMVVAFPGGKGTAHMVKIAREAGVPVVEVTRSTVASAP